MSPDINTRFRKIRKTLDKTQTEWAQIMGLSRSGVTAIESGQRNVTDKHIKLLCIEPINGKYINEEWLRSGEGDMFKQLPKKDKIAITVSNFSEERGEKTEIGKIIRTLRKEAGMTQEDLAQKLGLKKSAIAKYENGRVKNIKKTTLQKMSCLFNVSPAYIMGLSETLFAGTQHNRSLSFFDINLLSCTDKLSEIGKQKVLDYAKDISMNQIYCKESSTHNTTYETIDKSTT